MKKKRPWGIIIICLFILSNFLLIFMVSGMALMSTRLPSETKLGYMERDAYKEMNISTVEEWDSYFMSNAMRPFDPYGLLLILVYVVLIIGLMALNWWAYIGSIVFFSIQLIRNLIGVRTSDPVYFLFSFIFTMILVYMLQPKVREAFK